MRVHGDAATAGGLGLQDHLCWHFDAQDELDAAVLTFLGDGLALGARVEFVAPGSPEQLRARLAPLGDVDSLIARGALRLRDASAVYRTGRAPAEQRQVYVDATTEALALGFTGHRVAADATPLVATGAQRDAFARYEHLVDRAMTGIPFSAMCAYDRGVLGAGAVAELACLHPVARTEASPFALYATGRDGSPLAARGEVDALSAGAFSGALERAVVPGDPSEIRIDATHLDYLDHRGLVALQRHAQARSGSYVLEHATPVVARLAQLLDLSSVRVNVA